MTHRIQALVGLSLALMMALTTGCSDDSADDPKTIRETGYLTCGPGVDQCQNALTCEADNGDIECVTAPEGCSDLTCACLEETICGDRGCREEGGAIFCDSEAPQPDPEPFEPCEGKVCGDECNPCGNDEFCEQPDIDTACDLDGRCVAETPNMCGEELCEGTEDVVCGANEQCCVDRCCGSTEQCCAGIPVPPGEGLCQPMDQPCPQSRRDLKTGIRYMTEKDTERFSRQVQSIRLATYHYKKESKTNPKRLGFIIDDEPGPYAVTADGGHVNLYGYTSLAIATVQVQAREIESLKAELKALREDVAAIKAAQAQSSKGK